MKFWFHSRRNIFIFLYRFLFLNVKWIHLLSTFFLIYIRVCFLNTNAFLHWLLLFRCKNDTNVPKFMILFRNNGIKRNRIINNLFFLGNSLQLMLPIGPTSTFSWFLRFSILSINVFARRLSINKNFFVQMIIFRNSVWRMDSLRR